MKPHGSWYSLLLCVSNPGVVFKRVNSLKHMRLMVNVLDFRALPEPTKRPARTWKLHQPLWLKDVKDLRSLWFLKHINAMIFL